jgi:osmotically-inducible protein OsmY
MRSQSLKTASHRRWGRFVLLFAGLALAGSFSLPLLAAERPADTSITYWVREALNGDPLVDAAAIYVATENGIVTLTGSVRNLGSKTAAVEQAKKIQGVVGVLDEITTDPVWRPDADIANDIRHRIANSAVIEARDIGVSALEGEVVLQGHVATWVESEEAELLASETRGVRKVTNELVVDYEPSRTDQEIKNDAVAALNLDAYLRELPITVEVHSGTVTLSGTVGNLYERDRARDAVHWVSHVRNVDNELKVDWIHGDHSRSSRQVVTDDVLRKNVASQLQRDSRVDASKVDVAASRGHVTLSGTVPYGSQKRTATEDARDTVGVGWVTDDLVVLAPPRDDSAIRSDELFELAADYPLAGLNIDVGVNGGVVTLSGTVHTWYQKNHAQTIAWRPKGVKRVVNLLDVARDPKYSDSQIETKIESHLKWNWTTYWVHDDIDVNVDDGEVFLSGHVDTWSERAEAGTLAARVPGVWRVQNNLRVGDYPYSWDEWNDLYDEYPYGS